MFHRLKPGAVGQSLEGSTLFLRQILLHVFIVDCQQINPCCFRHIQVNDTAAAPLSFTTPWFFDTHLSQASATRHQDAFLRVLNHIPLKRPIYIIIKQVLNARCKGLCLNEEKARISYSVGYHFWAPSGNLNPGSLRQKS